MYGGLVLILISKQKCKLEILALLARARLHFWEFLDNLGLVFMSIILDCFSAKFLPFDRRSFKMAHYRFYIFGTYHQETEANFLNAWFTKTTSF